MRNGEKLKQSVRKFLNFSTSVKIFLSIMFLFFLVEVVIHIVPFLTIINNSLKTMRELRESSLKLTQSWAFVNYVDMFTLFKVQGDIAFFELLWNSIWQTGVFLFINLLSSMFVAYNLAKYRFPGRNLLFGIMIFTQTIPIIGSGAAGYRLRDALGMINNPMTIWVSWAMGFDYSAFIMYGTFQSVSQSYMEAAEIDGAGPFRTFFSIMLPQIIPVMLALCVTNFVGKWNDYSTAQIYLNEYPNLAFGLFQFEPATRYLKNGKGVYYAAMIITALPGILIYALSQGFIMKNVSVGGLKG